MVTYFFHLSHSSTGLPLSHSFLKTWAAVWSCESQHSISFEKCWIGPSYILKRSACWHSSALASVSRHNSTSIFQLLHFLQNYHFLWLFPGISIFWEPHPLQSSNTACFLIRKEKSCREACAPQPIMASDQLLCTFSKSDSTTGWAVFPPHPSCYKCYNPFDFHSIFFHFLDKKTFLA